MACKCAFRYATGVSLVEVVIVAGLISILLAAGLPQVFKLMDTMNREAATASLRSHLALARSTAISQRTRVGLIPESGQWTRGWQVRYVDFLDQEPLAVYWNRGQVRISANGALRREMIFDAHGRPTQRNGAFLSGTFEICSPSLRRSNRLILSATGRLREESNQESAC